MHPILGWITATMLVYSFFTICSAQDDETVQGTYADPATGIKFATWSSIPTDDGWNVYTFGMALPPDAATKDATEYIGLLRCQSVSMERTGWCGVGIAGSMLNSLLLIAWPHEGKVLTSFRLVSNYFMPTLYEGNATLTQISSHVNATSYEVLFRCQNCFAWDGQNGDDSTAGSVQTSQMHDNLVLGRAQAADGPKNAACPDEISYEFHNNGYGLWGYDLTSVVQSNYAAWAAMATKTVVGSCGAATSSPTQTP